MLFFPCSNRFFYWVASIKSVYRCAMTASIALALLCGWWFCVYKPLCLLQISRAQENQLIKQQYDNAIQERNLFVSLENTVKELGYDIDIYTTKISYNPQERIINDIIDIIQLSGLSLSTYKIERTIDKKSYTKSIIRLSLSGSYHQLISFFENIKTKKLLMTCDNVTMHNVESKKYIITCELTSFASFSKNPST